MPYTCPVPANEDVSHVQRRTVDGRLLTYRLTVLQQPERARACGAGARSSADRRPVDPPPVVELKVFQGEEQEDITLKHNATFILCASLENARPMANGRLHTPANIASLQGVNFAGTNYLDRPNPAGYFIFPDLSVRNEGWYRLNFSLFEGAKEPKDADPERPFTTPQHGQEGGELRSPMQHEDMAMRLDVTSKPFQVFSAKKFPGLSESTELSRLVADQGCRVRIRRDVRMRKHGERHKEEAESEGRRSQDRLATPDTAYHPQTPMDRPRSISRASMDGSQHSGDHYRRASVDTSYFGHQYHSGAASAGPSPGATYNAPVGPMSAAAGHQPYPGYAPAPAQAAAPLPPMAISSTFAIPEPRRAQENTSYGYSAPEPKNQYYSSPMPLTFARAMTPDVIPKPAVGRLPSVSSIHTLNNPTNGTANYDNRTRQWDIPQPPATKRSYSPGSSYGPPQALKGGMRPDAIRENQEINSIVGASMEADPTPYHSDSEDSFEDQGSMIMKYRRANGALGRKSVPNQQNQPQY